MIATGSGAMAVMRSHRLLIKTIGSDIMILPRLWRYILQYPKTRPAPLPAGFWWWNTAKLPYHTQLVKKESLFHDFAILDALHVEFPDSSLGVTPI